MMHEFLLQQQALPPAKCAITVADIRRLERAIDRSGQAITLPVEHHFSDGIYDRVLHIPAGTVLTGRTHKQPNTNLLVKGDITVLVDGALKRITAPCKIESPAGVKRVAFAHTDCTWVTRHHTRLTDLKQIEAEFLEPEPRLAMAGGY